MSTAKISKRRFSSKCAGKPNIRSNASTKFSFLFLIITIIICNQEPQRGVIITLVVIHHQSPSRLLPLLSLPLLYFAFSISSVFLSTRSSTVFSNLLPIFFLSFPSQLLSFLRFVLYLITFFSLFFSNSLSLLSPILSLQAPPPF